MNARNRSGKRILRVREGPRNSSDRPGIATTIDAAESNCVCIAPSMTCSPSAGTSQAKPHGLPGSAGPS